ncbi:unnamed protein product [Ceutorhynchus assimilis]|uniref:Uncharacterized protein n=1 Tax=Ceutorhynchus assimilis TaxID=467358 RepID=A0A9N9QH21_9CUCU|nr:unnamed protein product [Ceutorhynchus assimilis]
MHKSIKWSPAKPQKRPDNIISSKARESGNSGFKPSYLVEKRENMKFIMSNEYMRIWFDERKRYETETYSREQIIKEESKIKRRFVQRMMTYKKPNKNELTNAEYHIKKDGIQEHSVDYSKLKYKPVCPKEKGYAQDVLHKELKKNKSKDESRQNKGGKGDVQEAAICSIPCCPAAKAQ